MNTGISDCQQQFGHPDFAADRVTRDYSNGCPIKDCTADLECIPYGQRLHPFCPEHGIRLHSNTYVYWNGNESERREQARLRNFRFRPELARIIALHSKAKAESYRLGYELSEDALTWNVFVGLAEAGKLRDAARFLTARDIDAEPHLYLWGELVDVAGGAVGRFDALDEVRRRLERGIKRFLTEPDVMLVIPGKVVICIEAKFSSGNTLAYDGTPKDGEKPIGRDGLLQRYLNGASPETKRMINRNGIDETFHGQLFRNVIFASEMAKGGDWHVVNLVSETQWRNCRKIQRYSFADPTPNVRAYLKDDCAHSFTFRTWESLYRELIEGNTELAVLDTYMRSKSAHYRQAFALT